MVEDFASNGLCLNCREVYYTVQEVVAFCAAAGLTTVMFTVIMVLLCFDFYERRFLAKKFPGFPRFATIIQLQNAPRRESGLEMSLSRVVRPCLEDV